MIAQQGLWVQALPSASKNMEWIAVVSITVLAVISPGPDFAMVTRYSLLYGRRTGIWVAIGIALGVQVHVCYSLLGVAWLLQHSAHWLTAFKLLGASYLVWIGWQTLRSPSLPTGDAAATSSAQPAAPNAWAALRTGFFTNALNPKTTLFVVSLFAQVIQPGASLWMSIAYGVWISIAHALWFSAVAGMLSAPRIRQRVLHYAQWINRVIGMLLMAMGAALAVAP